ncbi:MAG: AraC family transcriptional regulator of adaptative response [Myxococcota bacterium]|jgi:AraC family transcriptional regulator of adaptative response/methylated-DNA-[protein]-cysteine methyltransferase
MLPQSDSHIRRKNRVAARLPAAYLPCMPSDYARIATAIRYLDTTATTQPSLAEVAAHIGLSEHHFQRLFRRWAGVSPKRFLQFLTVTHARQLLEDSHSSVQTAMKTGLSSPGRLHDLVCTIEAATPGELKKGGMHIRWGISESPYGRVMLGQTDRGVCWLDFLPDDMTEEDSVGRLAHAWPGADLLHHPDEASTLVTRIFAGERPALLTTGTNFQLQVWRALLRIPPGTVTSYGVLANAIGRSGASRAVGRAIGSNPIGYLIPCHRVIRQTGGFASYRWGLVRKKALLGHEAVTHRGGVQPDAAR